MFSALPGYERTGSGTTAAANPIVRRHPEWGSVSTDSRTIHADGTVHSTDAEIGALAKAANSGIRQFEFTVTESTITDQGCGIGLLAVPGATISDGSLTGTANVGRHMWFQLGTYNDYYNGDTKAIAGPGSGGTRVSGHTVGVVANWSTGVMSYYHNGAFVFDATGFTVTGYMTPAIQFYTAQTLQQATINGGDVAFAYPLAISGIVPWNNGL